MKLIIAGGRNIYPYPIIWIDHTLSLLISGYETRETITEVVSGGASGIDACGEEYALWNRMPTKVFKADWETHGKAAGPIRNKQMAQYADALFLVWDGKSRGSASMKQEMSKLGKPIYEVVLKEPLKFKSKKDK